jgi:DNA-binding transcriptional LysR family regulator
MSFDARMLSGIGVLAAVVDAGSFVHAGQALGLTQSGVSRAIAKLEERVGVRLFQRNSRAVALTEEGRRFYERVMPLIDGLVEAASEATRASEKPRGHLRVTVDPLVARIFIGPRATRFLSENSSISLDVTVRDRLGDMVAEGFDVAVRFGEPEPSSLITRKLLETRVLTCASPDYLKRRGRPKSPRELTDHECILFPDPRTRRPFEWVFQRGAKSLSVKVTGRFTVNDSAAQLAACVAGQGIAQPLELELRGHGDLGLVQLFPSWSEERYPLYVYYPSRLLPPAKVRAFVDFVIAVAAETVRSSNVPREHDCAASLT